MSSSLLATLAMTGSFAVGVFAVENIAVRKIRRKEISPVSKKFRLMGFRHINLHTADWFDFNPTILDNETT